MSDPGTDITNIQAAVMQLATDYANAQQDAATTLATLQGQLASVQESDTADQATIATLQAQISQLQALVTAAQQTDTTDQTSITTLKAQLATANATITSLQAQLAALSPASPSAPPPNTPPPVTLPTPPTADGTGHPLVYTTPVPATVDAVSKTGRSLQIQFAGGQPFTFNESTGTVLAPYQGSFVHQACTMVTRTDCGFTVFFRPDVSGSREEFVVELGKMFGAANAAAANVPAYTATFYKNGAQVAQVQVPYHWWFSRWRWQSAPRSLVRTAAQVAALYPKMTLQSVMAAKPTLPLVYRFPMDNAIDANGKNALLFAMGTVGDRNELGLMTEPQAIYLQTGDQIALASLLAQAETSGSIPWHMRDETTGAPVNLINHPDCWWSPAPAGVKNEQWVRTVAANAPVAVAAVAATATSPAVPAKPAGVASMWSIEDSHMGSLSFVPYMLTDDPYHLEELQFQASWGIGFSYYHRLNDGAINGVPQPVFSPSEPRSFAWDARTNGQCAYVSPASPPSWLLGQSYYTQLMSINLNYFNTVLTNPWPNPKGWAGNQYAGGWHFPVDPNLYSGFMVDYLLLAGAMLVGFGFTGWQSMVTFCAYLPKLLAANSGWSIQWPVPYEITLANITAVTPGDMATLWKNFVASNKIDVTKFPASGWAQGVIASQSPGYMAYRKASLSVLTKMGDTEAAASLSNINSMCDAVMASPGAGGYPYRWSYATA